ncbi:MAG: glycosyltransferase family 2 protein [Acidobacteriota bacterium]|nr:glycosyltransferase family 2 protein [Acidobacteriota bacterium]
MERFKFDKAKGTGLSPLGIQIHERSEGFFEAEQRERLARLRRGIDLFAASRNASEPLISVITPTWNTDPAWFLELAISVVEQSCLNWEWCLVDDCSAETKFHSLVDELQSLHNVTITRLTQPHGISRATNVGLECARGRYVCFVDHDDTLSRDALAESLSALEGGSDAVYTDSDKIDVRGNRSEPFHKPDWSPEFFRGVMYVGHLLSVRRDLARLIGGFNQEYDGVQDFEFLLRYSEITQKIAHIPKILYHWRSVEGSVAAGINAKGDLGRLQRRAVSFHLQRLRMAAAVEAGDFPHRLKIVPLRRQTTPRVSIIIPTKDSPGILRKCLSTLFSRTTYPNFEVLCVDNETTDPAALRELTSGPIQRLLFSGRFNFSKANNLARQYASGLYLVFMNNDVEVRSPDWIEQMLYYAEQSDVGAVGGLLLYPNHSVQHAGVVLGCRGTADHVLRGAPGDSDGYAGSLSCAREVSAVTGACLMMRTSSFDDLGGFNEHYFTAYQDVDLCLKLRAQGKRIIFTPRARLIHHESISRGKYYDLVDRNLLLDFWEPLIRAGDPYYNPNLDVQTCDYTLVNPLQSDG